MEILMSCVQQKQNQMNLFPIVSSYISIISPYVLDITDDKGGLMVFVKLHIPLRRLNDFKIPSSVQILPFEINLEKKNGQMHQFTRLHPRIQQNSTELGMEKVIILGNFNTEAENSIRFTI